VTFGSLEEVQQQLADAEEEAAACKVQCANAAEAAASAVAVRDAHLQRAVTGKKLVEVLMKAIFELEGLHRLQAVVRCCHAAPRCLCCAW
jgi:hypothetical protein